MDRKAWAILAILAAGLLWPLGRIWETWHRASSVCPPCVTPGAARPVAETGTCGYFEPILNANCPGCGRLWYDRRAPLERPSDRALGFLPRSRYPTVFAEPRICAMEGVYFTGAWNR